MSELQTAQEVLRKDEDMARETEATRQKLVRELQEYLDRQDSFESVNELQTVNRRITEIENQLVENKISAEIIAARLKGRKEIVTALIRKRFEQGERPLLTEQIVKKCGEVFGLLETAIVKISTYHAEIVRINEPLQLKSQDLIGSREGKADRHVRAVDNMLKTSQHILSGAKREAGFSE